ncbi:glycosyltransferase [Arsenicicoccus dermatophilus]|uniref:glycosyltransferase n=1 Tax=Arsenicicoccus dermatophilus TaxID=1076331 RepID=UPI003916FFA9
MPSALSGAAGPAREPSPVDAIVLVRDGAPWVADCLRALSGQTAPLRRLAIVLAGDSDDPCHAPEGLPEPIVVVARGCCDARAVRAGMAALRAAAVPEPAGSTPPERPPTSAVAPTPSPRPEPAAAPTGWVWVVQDDCRPEAGCLAHLLQSAAEHPTAAVLGPKHVDEQQPDRLVAVGLAVSRTGRRVAVPRAPELDQGQHDDRSQVLAAAAGALLVRADVLEDLGGPDPRLSAAWDLDLGWRVRDAGHEVLVVPQARARTARASERGLRSRERLPFAGVPWADLEARGVVRARVLAERADWERERRAASAAHVRRRRRASRQVVLARHPWWQVPLVIAQVLGCGLGLALLLLVAKRPRAARAELSDALSVLALHRWLPARTSPPRGGRSRVGDLLSPQHEALRGVTDELSRALPGARHPTAADGVEDDRPDLVEPGPVSDEAEDLPGEARGAGVTRHPVLLALLAAVLLTVVGWWGVLSQDLGGLRDRGLVGGELLPASGDAAAAWTRYLTSWSEDGAGTALPAPLWTPLLAGPAALVELLPGRTPSAPTGTTVALLLLVALPLAVLSAYLSGRVVTRRSWPRALVALAWGLSPALLVGLREGRVGAAALGLLLPPLLAGLAACSRRRPWWPAVGATLLVAAAAASVAPLLLVVVAVAGILVGGLGAGRSRVAGLLLVLVPGALLGPDVRAWWHGPELLLTGPGLARWGTAPRPWTAALLWPTEPALDPSLALPGPTWLQQGWPVLMAPVLLAGLAGMLVSGRRGRLAGPLAGLAVLALALACFAPSLTLARVVDQAGAHRVTAWTGAPVLLLTLALLAAALVGADAVWHSGAALPATSPGRVVRVLGWTLVGLLTLTVVAQACWLSVVRLDGQLRVGPQRLPGIAADGAGSALRTRYLALHPQGRSLGYELLPGDPVEVVRSLPRADAEDPCAAPVADLLGGAPAGGTSPTAARRLAALGVAFVGLQPAVPEVATTLDTTAGLARLTDPGEVSLWRVSPQGAGPGASAPLAVSAVQVLGPDGELVGSVPVRGAGPRASGDLPAGAATLAVARPSSWARTAEVSVDGVVVRAVDRQGLAAYPLPPGAHHVEIGPTTSWSWWRWAQLGLLAVVVVLALPLGARPQEQENR